MRPGPGARAAAAGSATSARPDELLPFFEAEDYAEVFAKVTHEPAYWTQRYREPDLYRRCVAEPIAAHYTRLAAAPVPAPLPPAPTETTETGSLGSSDSAYAVR